MGLLKILKVERYHRLDNVYLEVTVLDDGVERMEGFAGEEWLRKGEDGKPAFVARLIENKKCLDKAQVMSHEKVKKSVEGLELEV